MNSPDVYFLPLDQEMIQIARGLIERSDTIGSRVSEETQGRGNDLGVRFLNTKLAIAAMETILKFRALQASLGFVVMEHKRDWARVTKALKDTTLNPSERYSFIRINPNDLFPVEYYELSEEITDAALHYTPVYPNTISSMKQYLETYESMEILEFSGISIKHDAACNPTSPDIYALLNSYLTLARRVTQTILESRPINIVVTGTVSRLEVLMNGNIVNLSTKQIRGVAALAQLECDYWFSVEEFCKIAFPGSDTYEPRKQFDAALSVLKQYTPFGWDADEGLRRIRGAVIKAGVDKTVLHAHLNQKKSV